MALNEMFEDIDDDVVVLKHKSADSALGRLVAEYNQHSRRIDRLPDLTETSTGKDLKRGIAMLRTEEQVKLAYHYCLNQGIIEDESAASVDSRKFRQWLIKAGVACSAAFMFALMGAVMAYINGHHIQEGRPSADNGGVQVFLSTAAEIAKILLSKE